MAKKIIYIVLSMFITSIVILSGVAGASAPRWWLKDTEGRDMLSYGSVFTVDGREYAVQLDLLGHGYKQVRFLGITSLEGRFHYFSAIDYDPATGGWESARICTPVDLRDFGPCEEQKPTGRDLFIAEVLSEQVEQDQYAFANWDQLWDFEMNNKHIREEVALTAR